MQYPIINVPPGLPPDIQRAFELIKEWTDVALGNRRGSRSPVGNIAFVSVAGLERMMPHMGEFTIDSAHSTGSTVEVVDAHVRPNSFVAIHPLNWEADEYQLLPVLGTGRFTLTIHVRVGSPATAARRYRYAVINSVDSAPD